jgi:hypothetical protein
MVQKTRKQKLLTLPMVQKLVGKTRKFVKTSSGKSAKYTITPNIMIHKSKKLSVMIVNGVLKPSSMNTQEKQYAHIQMINAKGDYQTFPVEFTKDHPEGVVKGIRV